MTINVADYIQLDRRDTSGAGVMAAAQIYGTTANTAAVTQLTSRTTGVTLNNPVGIITLVSAAGSQTDATFTVTNSFVAVSDIVNISAGTGTDPRRVAITTVANGSFNVTTAAISGATTESPTLNFIVHKCSII